MTGTVDPYSGYYDDLTQAEWIGRLNGLYYSWAPGQDDEWAQTDMDISCARVEDWVPISIDDVPAEVLAAFTAWIMLGRPEFGQD